MYFAIAYLYVHLQIILFIFEKQKKNHFHNTRIIINICRTDNQKKSKKKLLVIRSVQTKYKYILLFVQVDEIDEDLCTV